MKENNVFYPKNILFLKLNVGIYGHFGASARTSIPQILNTELYGPVRPVNPIYRINTHPTICAHKSSAPKCEVCDCPVTRPPQLKYILIQLGGVVEATIRPTYFGFIVVPTGRRIVVAHRRRPFAPSSCIDFQPIQRNCASKWCAYMISCPPRLVCTMPPPQCIY